MKITFLAVEHGKSRWYEVRTGRWKPDVRKFEFAQDAQKYYASQCDWYFGAHVEFIYATRSE